jgi:hypothetical protein
MIAGEGVRGRTILISGGSEAAIGGSGVAAEARLG